MAVELDLLRGTILEFLRNQFFVRFFLFLYAYLESSLKRILFNLKYISFYNQFFETISINRNVQLKLQTRFSRNTFFRIFLINNLRNFHHFDTLLGSFSSSVHSLWSEPKKKFFYCNFQLY